MTRRALLLLVAGALPALAGAAPAAAPAPASAPASFPASAPTSPPVRRDLTAAYVIEARIDPSARTLSGTARIRVANTGPTPRAWIDLWLYPNALATRPRALDEVNFYWEYPRFFDPAGMELGAARVGGLGVTPLLEQTNAGPRTRARLGLPAPLPPGASVEVEVAFRVKVPKRYGAFGCTGGECRLMFGWYPLVADGPESLPASSRVEVRLRAPAGHHVVIGGTWVPPASRRGDAACAVVDGVRYAPLAVLRRAHASTRVHRGVRLTYLSSYRPPPRSDRLPLPYVLQDYPGLALDAAAEALDLLADLGWRPADFAGAGGLLLVEGEVRRDLAQSHGGLVLVSDQLYRIFPLDRFRKFHTFQLLRALYEAVLQPRLQRSEPAADLGWVGDALASYLVDLFTVWRYRRAEFARDVLKYVSFVPAIDALMYAPKVNFSSAYFGDVVEPEGFRDDPARWNNRHPRGRLVYHKLRDRLGQAGFGRAAALAIGSAGGARPLRAAAGEVAARPLDHFIGQWLGPYPTVNYRLGVVESRRVGARWRHRIEVIRDFAPDLEEVIEVLVVDQRGRRLELRWDGRGPRTVLEAESDAAISSITIDPRARLGESYPDRNEDARFDNRTPPRFKLIYNGLGALFNFQSLQLDAILDFSLRRVYDLRNSIRILVFRDAAADFGARLGYSRYFGAKVDANRLTSGVGMSLIGSRLNPDYAVDPARGPLPGTRLTLAVSGFYDDRFSIIDPWRVKGLYGGVSYTATVLDTGAVYNNATVAVEGLRLFDVAPGHVLAADLNLALTAGNLKLRNQMVQAGGPYHLRGYDAGELLGRARAVLRLEYRHVFVHGLTWNLGHLVYLRGFGGALLAEAAALSTCDGYAPTRNGLFADVGYSLRGFFDYLGVSQAVMSLDVAVPLQRNVRRSCFGASAADDILAGRRSWYLMASFAPSF
ncbi:MAG: hypothetical protein HY906_17640 [Deltaproteobacteria bacterium]|nr:hypothetical protein [Deltaproteobacteria bacterium]